MTCPGIPWVWSAREDQIMPWWRIVHAKGTDRAGQPLPAKPYKQYGRKVADER